MFKYIKSKRNDVAGVFPLKDKQGKTQTGDDKIAKIINEHYCSVFFKREWHNPKHTRTKGIKDRQYSLYKKRPSENSITARFLKECAEVIVDAFVQLFNTSLKRGKVPDDWKKCIVTPICKGGNKPRSAAEPADQ